MRAALKRLRNRPLRSGRPGGSARSFRRWRRSAFLNTLLIGSSTVRELLFQARFVSGSSTLSFRLRGPGFCHRRSRHRLRLGHRPHPRTHPGTDGHDAAASFLHAVDGADASALRCGRRTLLVSFPLMVALLASRFPAGRGLPGRSAVPDHFARRRAGRPQRADECGAGRR